MSLMPGTRLGAYEIVAAIGAGGMGEVYRARDPKLNRDVAIKVLPEVFASDPDRLARFEREARAIATLSHPNILSIHEFGSAGRTTFAVMELLDGETLRQRLSGGPLGARKALDYAAQVAKGLAAAHEKGIVHRDLKPDNVFVTTDGHVKLLDFGLARHFAPVFSEADRTVSVGTDPGVVMGTPGYMSPEQVRGLPTIDHRSDIFSFGAVLYEMLSGRRAFSRDSAAETMTAILKEDPPELTESGRGIPPAVDRLVRHCLEKRPDERFQSARDLAFAIQDAESGAAPAVAKASPKKRRTAVMLPAVAGAAVLAFVAGRWTTSTSPSPEWQRAEFRAVTTTQEAELWPNLAPDGKSVVYSSAVGGNMDIYAQRIGGHNRTNLTKDSPDIDDQPAFSPDGSRVAFHSTRGGGGIFVMGATGESVRRVSDFGYNPAWSPDSRFIVVSDTTFIVPQSRPRAGKLWVISVEDGSRRELPTGDALQPSWSPSGTRIAYWGVIDGGQRDIWTIAADGSAEPVRVTNDAALDWNPVWAPDGRSVYFASDRTGTMNIARILVDERTGRASGSPEAVTAPAGSAGALSFSRDGNTLLYGTEHFATTLYAASFDSSRRQLAGSPQVVLEGAQEIDYIDVSPDGEWIAFGSKERQEDLFVIRRDGSGLRQLTDDVHRDRGPRWSPDGSRLAFYSSRLGPYTIWSIRPDGSRLEPVTRVEDGTLVRPAWAPDGRRLTARTEGGRPALINLERPPGARLQPLNGLPEWTFVPQAWSPDGRFIAGAHEGGPGSDRILVFSLDGTLHSTNAAAAQVWEGSLVWLADSRHLLFTTHESGIRILDTADGTTREVLPRPRGLGEIPAVAKGLNSPVLAFVEMRNHGDLWIMQRR
jgi:serine/threonine protein kinase/Tol biopolymer transport system component